MTGPFGAVAGDVVADVRRLAVLRANSIGDFVLAVPALSALRAAYPRAEITVLGDSWHPKLLDGRPGPWDRVEVVPPYAGVRGEEPEIRTSAAVDQFFEGQCRRRYDMAVQIHGGGANSNPFVSAMGARLTVGLRDRGAPALGRWIPYRPYQHEVHRFLEVAGLVGACPVELEPRLTVTPADRVAAASALLDGTGPLVVVHPGANDVRRRWPPRSFAAVADALAGDGCRVVVVGHGEVDDQAGTAMAQAMTSQPLNLVGRLSLSALLGVFAGCSLVVANDSGPRHLAAAVGAPTVGIYWSRNLINTGPLSAARHSVAVSFRTDCANCGTDLHAASCGHDGSFVADVPVEEVLASARDLLASR